jgi:hypothetical protein
VDANTGLYQVDWILYRQIVASELGAFLATPAEPGVKKSFKMLLKLKNKVPSEENPWFDDAVKVDLQVPMISSPWFPVLMKKSLADSLEVTTKLADDRLTIGVVEIEWVPGDKDPSKRLPAVVGIKRWGSWPVDLF